MLELTQKVSKMDRKPILPSYPNFRVWKIVEGGEGRVIHLKKRIKRPNQLLKIIKKYGAKTVWYSNALYLNPTGVKGRDNWNYEVADNLVLGFNELEVDIDNKSLEKARLDTLKITGILESKGMSLTRIKVTGHKGFQLVYDLGRIYSLKEFISLKEVLTPLLEPIESFDKEVFTDLRRVYRCANTPNKGNWCFFTNTLSGSCEEPKAQSDEMVKSQQDIGAEAIRDTLPSTYKFISNMVSGAKNTYVPYLKVKKLSVIERISKTYNHKFYVFKDTDCYGCLSVKTVDENRLLKMMRACHSLNLNSFLKYGHSWIRTSSIISDDTLPRMEFMCVLGIHPKTGSFSNPHINLLESYGIKEEFENVCGKENNILRCEKKW